MMFAKLSFMPRMTISSMVTTPARSNGMSVSSTSPNRRSTIQSRIVIEASAQKPASKNARTTVRPDSRIEIGPPIALGSTSSTARANRRKVSLSLGSPFGRMSTFGAPVLGDPFARDLGGQSFERDRLRLQIVAQLVERDIERRDHGGMCARPQGFVALGDLGKFVGKPFGGGRARARSACRRLASRLVDGGRERGDFVGIGRRLLAGVRPQHRTERGRELMNGGELGLLVIGNEALDRLHARDFRQPGELLDVGPRRLLVRRQHVDRARADARDRFANPGRSQPIRPSGFSD